MVDVAITLEGGKYKWVNRNGVIAFYRHGEYSDCFVGSKPVLALLQEIQRLRGREGVYMAFHGDVETAAHKVQNDRLEDALEELEEGLKQFEEED